MFSLLICDDHPPIRTALRLLARQAAPVCDVTECGTAHELLRLLAGRRPFDLLTLDLRLPDRSGLTVLADVQAARPGLPVMVLSADESPASVAAAIGAGACRYVFKSADENELFDTLREIVGNTRPVAAAAGPRTTPVSPERALGLSDRQAEVLQCLLRGMSARQIAQALGIADGTVKSHTVAVFRALNVSTRTQAVVEAHRRGITVDQ